MGEFRDSTYDSLVVLVACDGTVAYVFDREWGEDLAIQQWRMLHAKVEPDGALRHGKPYEFRHYEVCPFPDPPAGRGVNVLWVMYGPYPLANGHMVPVAAFTDIGAVRDFEMQLQRSWQGSLQRRCYRQCDPFAAAKIDGDE
jgi:hypothetical protein